LKIKFFVFISKVDALWLLIVLFREGTNCRSLHSCLINYFSTSKIARKGETGEQERMEKKEKERERKRKKEKERERKRMKENERER
jgi:hypothetical protein